VRSGTRLTAADRSALPSRETGHSRDELMDIDMAMARLQPTRRHCCGQDFLRVRKAGAFLDRKSCSTSASRIYDLPNRGIRRIAAIGSVYITRRRTHMK
jgi:hypothetical protein